MLFDRATKEELAMPEMPYEIEAGTSSILGKSYQKRGGHKAVPQPTHFYSLENSV